MTQGDEEEPVFGWRPDPEVHDAAWCPSARARRLSTWLGATALVVLPVGVFGATNPVHLVLVERILGHPFEFALVVAALASAAVIVRLRRGLRAAGALGGAALIGSLVATDLAMLAWSEQEPAPELTRVAPGGKWALQVHTSSDLIDTSYHLRIQQRHAGLLARQWPVGCVSDDEHELRTIHWASASTLIVEFAREPGSTLTVRVDPSSGRPLTRPAAALQGC